MVRVMVLDLVCFFNVSLDTCTENIVPLITRVNVLMPHSPQKNAWHFAQRKALFCTACLNTLFGLLVLTFELDFAGM